MNKLETIIYNLVRKNPAIKQLVRNVYQTTFDLLPRKKEYCIHTYQYKEGYFFGFHDISPISADDSKLLANHYLFDLRMPLPGEGLELGYFDLCNGKFGNFHKVDMSYAWNYHKGCRLQWVDEKNIIFNTGKNNKLISKIVNIETEKENVIDYPIDAIHAPSMLATSFSYERLERCMPGYGYPYIDGGYVGQDIPDETGLFLVNLNTNTRRLLVPISQLVDSISEEYQKGFLHFVTHSEFSPNGRYISFLHRWISRNGNYMKRWTRIIVYDLETDKLCVLPSQNSGSHYVWNEKNQIIASCIIDGDSTHVLFDMKDPGNYKLVAKDVLNSDGHQSFITDTSFVTDTYPDKYRMAKLFKVDVLTEKVELLASLYSPKIFQTKDFKCHIACDLHPRVSNSKKYICWDSPRTGKRAIYLMNIS